MAKLSDTMLTVLRNMVEDQAQLVRWRGGFWTTAGTKAIAERDGYSVPDWWCSRQTVEALEKRGLVRCVGETTESWRDPREITDAGRAEVI